MEEVKLVKFIKDVFQKKSTEQEDGLIIHHDGKDISIELAYWGFLYAQTTCELFFMDDNENTKEDCYYHALSKENILSIIERIKNDVSSNSEEIKDIQTILEKILSETNFETEQIAYIWEM